MSAPHPEPEKISPLFRWSKQIDGDRLEGWETALTAAGIPFVVEKAAHRKRWQIGVYEQERSAAEDLRLRFGGRVVEIRPESWIPRSKGEAPPAPILIRDRLVITESDEPAEIARLESEYPGREVLSFPPRLAFGTGSHPTTASCLRFLADASAALDPGRWHCLDLGAGSGILAIAAERLGAGSALAIEFDPLAIPVARENAIRHGTKRVEFLQTDLTRWLRAGEPEHGEVLFDVVAANLFSELLIDIFPRLTRRLKPGGRLILSGFLASQTGEVTAAARAAGFELDRFVRRGKWVAALGTPRLRRLDRE